MKYTIDNMEQVSYPGSINHASNNFVISAGCILFRKSPVNPNQVQICLLFQPKDLTLKRREKWILPKGRKDLGETIEATAVRETYEETGFPCEFMPVRFPYCYQYLLPYKVYYAGVHAHSGSYALQS